MSSLLERLPALRRCLAEAGDAERAEAMAAYLHHRFAFFGVATPERRRHQRQVWTGAEPPDGDHLIEHARACWSEPERELQYAGCDALRRWQRALEPPHLAALAELVAQRAWWDSVDPLAVHAVGGLVRRHRHLQQELDRWADGPDPWLARAAILHQLLWKDETDAERLFAYVARRGDDPDWFLRKASGWALRQHSRTDPVGVRRFVEEQGERLSPLTRREALAHL